MKRKLGLFRSNLKADAAEKEYYQSLSPAERIELLLFLRNHCSPYGDELTHSFKRVCRIVSLREASAEHDSARLGDRKSGEEDQ
jgi:hypothetical protein